MRLGLYWTAGIAFKIARIFSWIRCVLIALLEIVSWVGEIASWTSQILFAIGGIQDWIRRIMHWIPADLDAISSMSVILSRIQVAIWQRPHSRKSRPHICLLLAFLIRAFSFALVANLAGFRFLSAGFVIGFGPMPAVWAEVPGVFVESASIGSCHGVLCFLKVPGQLPSHR